MNPLDLRLHAEDSSDTFSLWFHACRFRTRCLARRATRARACTRPTRPRAARRSTRNSAPRATATTSKVQVPMPPLAGMDFLTNWTGKTVGDLYEKTQTTMPATAPGTLMPEQAADVLAFMLKREQVHARLDSARRQDGGAADDQDRRTTVRGVSGFHRLENVEAGLQTRFLCLS